MSSRGTSDGHSPAGPDPSRAEGQRPAGWRSLRSKFFASGIILLMTVLTTLMLFLPFLNYELDQQIEQQDRFNQENIAQEAETIARLLIFELSRMQELWDVRYYAQQEMEDLSVVYVTNLGMILSFDQRWNSTVRDLQIVLTDLEVVGPHFVYLAKDALEGVSGPVGVTLEGKGDVLRSRELG